MKRLTTATLFFLLLTVLGTNFVNAQTITTEPTIVISKQTTNYVFDNSFLFLNTTSLYNWNWGDGTDNTTTATPAATHIYRQDGTYTITIVVTSPLTIDGWNVSSDWQSVIGTYTNNVIVTKDTVARIGNNIIANLAMFGILPIAIGAFVFFIILKSNGSTDNGLPALFSAIIVIILTEICIYIAVFAVNAINI